MLSPSADPVVLIMRGMGRPLARRPLIFDAPHPAGQFAVILPVLAPAC